MPTNDRLARLARHIETRAGEDERLLLKEREIAELRRNAARELHSICAEFVASLNKLLPRAAVELSPPEYTQDAFRERGANLIQINSHGRILQVAFEATRQLVSTDKFKLPYILEGEVRAFNQQMLARNEIRSQWLFFSIEQPRAWHVLDWRTNRLGRFNRELLVSLMEGLV